MIVKFFNNIGKLIYTLHNIYVYEEANILTFAVFKNAQYNYIINTIYKTLLQENIISSDCIVLSSNIEYFEINCINSINQEDDWPMIPYIDPETKLLYEVIKTITDEYMLDIDELYKYLTGALWISLTAPYVDEKLHLTYVRCALVKRILYHLTYLAIGVSSTN